jgi:DNA protecting protein DprA
VVNCLSLPCVTDVLDGNYPNLITLRFRPAQTERGFSMQTEVPIRAEDYALTRKLQWLALSQTPGIGAGRARKLLEHFGSVDRLFAASLTELEACGLPPASAQSLALGKSLELAAAEYDRVREMGASVIVRGDAEYPSRLLEIYDPPLVLYVNGSPEILNTVGLAVIGTRHPTPYGIGMAERLACDLSARGILIISGMARGIDTAAHRGALNAHGRTLAVWGTGIDEVYPKENRKLSEQILASGGAIVSEFSLGTFPAEQNFPSPQPDHQRIVRRRPGSRGRRVQRNPDYRPLRPGAGSGGLRRPRQCNQQTVLEP